MSAAATAAGYLYAAGRLRGRNAKEGELQEPEKQPIPKRRELLKVAVIEPTEEMPEPQVVSRPKLAPKIEYRTRRWKRE